MISKLRLFPLLQFYTTLSLRNLPPLASLILPTLHLTTQTGQNIPQLDGRVDASSTQPQKLQGGPSPEFQSNAPFNYQCENCKDLFETNSTLKLHADQYQFGCEDCSICFTSEESFDRHELAEHPETFYTHHPIPNTVIQNSTKFNFSASYR